MKQLNFRHFNTNSKKFFETVSFFQKEEKTRPKRTILFCFVYQGVFGHFTTTFISYFRRLPKISEDYRNFTKANEEVRPLAKMSKEPSKHLTVLSSETANIKKLANLTANTKNYGQITLNTTPHSDPLRILISLPYHQLAKIPYTSKLSLLTVTLITGNLSAFRNF